MSKTGAHHNVPQIAKTIQERITKDLKVLGKKDIDTLVNERIEKFCAMGVVVE